MRKTWTAATTGALVAGLIGAGLFGAGLLIAGHSQRAYASICYTQKIVASSHSSKNALRGVAQKARARLNKLVARGVDASLPYAPTCKSNSGRTTCLIIMRVC